MVVGFLIRNFFDDFFVDDNALMFWFLIGTALGRSGNTKLEIDQALPKT